MIKLIGMIQKPLQKSYRMCKSQMLIHPCLVKVGYIVITHNWSERLACTVRKFGGSPCPPGVDFFSFFPDNVLRLGIFCQIDLILHLDILSDQQKLNPSAYCLCKKCCWMDTVEESFCCLSKYKKSVEG